MKWVLFFEGSVVLMMFLVVGCVLFCCGVVGYNIFSSFVDTFGFGYGSTFFLCCLVIFGRALYWKLAFF